MALLMVVVAGGCGAGEEDVSGVVVLPRSFDIDQTACHGSGSAAMVDQGFAIAVSNELESFRVRGVTERGLLKDGACTFPFTISGVPRGAGRYRLEAGDAFGGGWGAAVSISEAALFDGPVTVELSEG